MILKKSPIFSSEPVKTPTQDFNKAYMIGGVLGGIIGGGAILIIVLVSN